MARVRPVLLTRGATMSRPTTLVAALVALVSALVLAPGGPSAARVAAEDATARTGGCHRTLAHYPVLLPGDRRPAVRTLQCALRDAGYGPVVVDGFYGPQTRVAVARVEAGFEGPAPQPGRVDNGFWVLLFGRHLPDRTLRLGAHGPAVRTLQRALRAAGCELAVDGDFGRQTRHAVGAYQRSQHVAATGAVNERTRFFLAMGGVLHGLD
jgi:peptidoglycan hydrolase-like protein with peptidoglycan-binding domain